MAANEPRRRGPEGRKQPQNRCMRKAQLHLGESSGWCQTPLAATARSLGEAGWRSLPSRKSCPLSYPLDLARCPGAASEASQQHSSNSTPPGA